MDSLIDDERLLMRQYDNTRLVVALPQREFSLDMLPATLTLDDDHGLCRVTRLGSGAETIVDWTHAGSSFNLSAPITLGGGK